MWCWALLAAAAVALVCTALVDGLTDRQTGNQAGALPGLTGFAAALLAVQAALLILLAAAVAALARGNRVAVRDAYLGGWLAVLVTLLGILLGGLLTGVISLGATRLLGTPVPSGFQFDKAPQNPLTVPWPVYVFGAAPIGVLCGAIAAAIPLFRRYQRRRGEFGKPAKGNRSPVANAYDGSTVGAVDGDNESFRGNRDAIARAWAVGSMVEGDATAAMLAVIAGGMLVLLVAQIAAAAAAGPAGHPVLLAGWLHGLASLVAGAGILVVGWLVLLLRQAYSDPAKRRIIGAVWDVGTFWPRAVHPLAPPCYAERAIPEVVDRIRLLTGCWGAGAGDIPRMHSQAGQLNSPPGGLSVPDGPVLLTGYSQGAIIAPAVVAQLPRETQDRVALLTLACPARRLYGRAFPAYFGGDQLDVLFDMLTVQEDQPYVRWKNLCRRSDYIGSYVFTDIFAGPAADAGADELASTGKLKRDIDQLCLDPVILVPDGNPTPPPVHRHAGWWPDPRTNEMADQLVKLLRQSASAKPARESGVTVLRGSFDQVCINVGPFPGTLIPSPFRWAG
jgi:hypothetical protein